MKTEREKANERKKRLQARAEAVNAAILSSEFTERLNAIVAPFRPLPLTPRRMDACIRRVLRDMRVNGRDVLIEAVWNPGTSKLVIRAVEPIERIKA